jgi:hypothetical protein
LGFAAWHFRGLDVREDGAETELDLSHENQLILLSEYQQNEQTQSGGKLCYSLGPFINKSESKKAQEQFKSNNVEAKEIQLRDTSRSGFWVTLPASESRQEAKKQIERLKKLNVKDYFLVAKGTHENAISLGVYSQKKLARRRVDEIIRLGFIPRLENVPLPRKVYWLNWYKDSKQQPKDAILNEIMKQQPQISKIERSCK